MLELCRVPGSIVQYCAIGINTAYAMYPGADSIIGSLGIDNQTPQVYDFVLNNNVEPANASCPNSVCQDSNPAMGTCRDNVMNAKASRNGEYLLVEFDRPLLASDSCDKNVTLDEQSDYFLWAMGFGIAPSVHIHVAAAIVPYFYWNAPIPTTGAVTTRSLTTGVTSGITSGITSGVTSGITSGVTSQAVTSGVTSAVTSQEVTSEAIVTSGITSEASTSGITSNAVTSGITTNAITSGVQSITSGKITTGVSSLDITTDSLSNNLNSPSSTTSSSSNTILGFKNYVFILIVIGAILVFLAIVTIIIVFAMKVRHDKFKGFY